MRALENAGLKYTDIQPVYLAPADALAAFSRGSVDAWVIWDPYEAAAEASTGARILTDGTGLVANHQFYFSSKKFLAENAKAVDVVLDALNETDAWVKDHIDEVAAQLSPSIGLPAEVLAVSLKREAYGIRPINDEVIAEPAAHRRHVFRAWARAQGHHRFRSSAQAGIMIMTASKSSSANILWFLPTHGDGRYLGTTTGGREVNFNYLRQIAQAADQLGYYGVLLPTGRSCEDSWIVASALAPFTERLRYLVAVRPGPAIADVSRRA